MSRANEYQVGGRHYATATGYQHWDLVTECRLPYLEGCATKYIARWRAKGGAADLRKARHYVEKLREVTADPGARHRHMFYRLHPGLVGCRLDMFFASAGCGPTECNAIRRIALHTTDQDLDEALGYIDELLKEAGDAAADV